MNISSKICAGALMSIAALWTVAPASAMPMSSSLGLRQAGGSSVETVRYRGGYGGHRGYRGGYRNGGLVGAGIGLGVAAAGAIVGGALFGQPYGYYGDSYASAYDYAPGYNQSYYGPSYGYAPGYSQGYVQASSSTISMFVAARLSTTFPACSKLTVTRFPTALCTWPRPQSGREGWRIRCPGSAAAACICGIAYPLQSRSRHGRSRQRKPGVAKEK